MKQNTKERASRAVKELNKKNKEINLFNDELNQLTSKYSENFLSGELGDVEYLKIELNSKLEEISSISIDDEELAFLCEENTMVHQNYSKFNQQFKETKQVFEKFIKQLEFDSKYLYIVDGEDDACRLWIYDIETQKREDRLIPVAESLGAYTCFVQLPNSELFIYGNSDSSGYTCIFDLENFTLKKLLQYGAFSEFSTGIYCSKAVYVFGGCDETSEFLTRKFDLEENRWITVNSPPEPSPTIRCTNFKNSIILCGNENSHPMKYDIKTDSYSVINNLDISEFPYKFIWSDSSNIYLIGSSEDGTSSIFEATVSDEYTWINLGEFNFRFYVSISAKFYKNSVYLSLFNPDAEGESAHSCYRFDLKGKNLEEIKEDGEVGENDEEEGNEDYKQEETEENEGQEGEED